MAILQADDFPGVDCPPWCDGNHSMNQSRLPKTDLTHVRSAGLQPVIAGATSSGDPLEACSTEFDVVRYQSAADTEEWVFVGDDATAWTVTTESAARIYRALGEVLVGVDPYEKSL